MIFQLFKWHFDINWYKFEKRWADVFQIYPNAIHFNNPQFCPSLSLLSSPVFCLSCSIVLSRYFVISVNSMTTWSMLKLPKIAWPSPFKQPRRRGRQKLHNIVYLATKNKSFARFVPTVFIFVHLCVFVFHFYTSLCFAVVLVLSTTWNDLLCSCVNDVSM